jgi:hypothetical protein
MKKAGCIILVFWLAAAGCEDIRFQVRRPPGKQIDVFSQSAVPVIDVLWVVDNSASMKDEQEQLAQNFGQFFKYLQATGADYHIGVISTDVYNPEHQGRLLGENYIISANTPDAEAAFAANVNVGTSGKGDEQGLRAAELALSEPLLSGRNRGFLRQQAWLYIIFVSDEDDHSFGPVEYHIRALEQIKGIGNDGMVKVAAIVGDVPQVPEACRLSQGVRPGVRYAQVSAGSGGPVLSICDDNFSANLDALGFSAAGLKKVFTLTRAPEPGTLAVWVKTSCSTSSLPADLCQQLFDDCAGSTSELYGRVCVMKQTYPDGWYYDQESNSVRFLGRAVPPFGAVIEIGYIPLEELP